MSAALLVLWLVSALAVGSAVMVVTTPYVLHAALWLVVSLAAVAGYFLVMTAELLAWVQLLVYAGAVVVLLLFALMLTRSDAVHAPADSRHRPAAALVAFAVFGLLAVTLTSGFRGIVIDLDPPPDRLTGVRPPPRIGDAETVGEALFTHWVLGFELLSVVLVAALVGAIVVSGRVRERDRDPSGGGPG